MFKSKGTLIPDIGKEINVILKAATVRSGATATLIQAILRSTSSFLWLYIMLIKQFTGTPTRRVSLS